MAGGTTDLNRLTERNDPVLGGVHGLRDSYKADLVGLIVEGRDRIPAGVHGLCGYASPQGLPLAKDRAFSAVERECIETAPMGNLFNLAHETGHSMGLAHNHEVNAPGALKAFPYSVGFTVPGEFRTIMGYVFDEPCNCPKIQYFSTPNVVNQQGRPMGIPDFVDAARSLNETVAMEAAATAIGMRATRRTPATATGTRTAYARLGAGLGRAPAGSRLSTATRPARLWLTPLMRGKVCEPVST
jgi:peptidyl-Asp metalloendopeptidase